MLRGFFLSGVVRAYAIATGFAVQLLLSNVTSKVAFGQINAFMSTVLLLTFLLTSAPTRQLVRELGAFGITARRQLANEFIGNAHVWLILSLAVSFIAASVGQPSIAFVVGTTGFTFAAAIYSAYFRGLGHYVIGNFEAGVMRSTIFIALLVIAVILGFELAVPAVKTFYLSAVAIGFFLLVIARRIRPSLEFSRRTLWPYGTFPLTLTILAGLEIFFVNFDIIVTAYLYGPDVTAEVRVAQQLRSLTMLPLQVYLMFSLDRLSRTLQTGVDMGARRREIALVRVLLGATFLAAIGILGPFGTLYFEGGMDFLTAIAVLSGVVPMVLFGPRAELVIAGATEENQKRRTLLFLVAYVVITPFLCWEFDLPPATYFCFQAAASTLFFAILPNSLLTNSHFDGRGGI